MNYFRILCADDNIDADRPYYFHNSRCPECGHQGRVLGYDYPAIDLSTIYSKQELKKNFVGQAYNPVDWSVLVESQKKIRSKLGFDLELPMVCFIGQLKGKITGRLTDFEGLPDSTICCQQKLADSLKQDGLKDLVVFETRLRSKNHEPFVEFLIPKQAEADPSFFVNRCDTCLKSQGDIKKLKITKASVLDGGSLVRIKGSPFTILASEQFKQIYDDRKYTGLKFYPVEFI